MPSDPPLEGVDTGSEPSLCKPPTKHDLLKTRSTIRLGQSIRQPSIGRPPESAADTHAFRSWDIARSTLAVFFAAHTVPAKSGTAGTIHLARVPLKDEYLHHAAEGVGHRATITRMQDRLQLCRIACRHRARGRVKGQGHELPDRDRRSPLPGQLDMQGMPLREVCIVQRAWSVEDREVGNDDPLRRVCRRVREREYAIDEAEIERE